MVVQEAATIGMKIDTIIASITNTPVTYQLFLGLCIIFSATVLNIATGGATVTYNQQQEQSSKLSTVATDPVKSSRNAHNEPEPKWHILKTLNIAVVLGFITSIGYFAFDATTFMNDSGSLLKFSGVLVDLPAVLFWIFWYRVHR